MADITPLEAETQRDILLDAPYLDCTLLRNNVGAMQDKTGRWVFYGLGSTGQSLPGTSDEICWTKTKITPEMVGTTVAVFTAIEVKRKGKKPTDAQARFVSAVVAAGGIAAVCYSVEEFKETILAYRSRLTRTSTLPEQSTERDPPFRF